MRKVLLQTGGDEVEVVLERVGDAEPACFAVTAGDRHAIAEIESTGPETGRMRLDGRIAEYYARRRGSSVEVWVAGRRHVIEIVDRTAQRAAGGGVRGAACELTAPMPGRILRVIAVAGQAFEAHAPLIVMESMKMEMTISAPAAGRVKDVLCVEDALVEMGEILARLDPPDPGEIGEIGGEAGAASATGDAPPAPDAR